MGATPNPVAAVGVRITAHLSGEQALAVLRQYQHLVTLVTGGRNYTNAPRVWNVLDILQPDTLIEGGASGADTHAREWSTLRRVRCHTYHAEWETYGLTAGPRRNARMIAEGRPGVVIAFPGGSGTANMVKCARVARVPVIVMDA